MKIITEKFTHAKNPNAYYVIEDNEHGGYNWRWDSPAIRYMRSAEFPTIAEAMADAAADSEDLGDPTLTEQLRNAAELIAF